MNEWIGPAGAALHVVCIVLAIAAVRTERRHAPVAIALAAMLVAELGRLLLVTFVLPAPSPVRLHGALRVALGVDRTLLLVSPASTAWATLRVTGGPTLPVSFAAAGAALLLSLADPVARSPVLARGYLLAELFAGLVAAGAIVFYEAGRVTRPLVLKALARGPAFGPDLLDRLDQNRTLVGWTMRALERQGLLDSYAGEPRPERASSFPVMLPKLRYYKLTAAGALALQSGEALVPRLTLVSCLLLTIGILMGLLFGPHRFGLFGDAWQLAIALNFATFAGIAAFHVRGSR